jgi:hypothetical protein
VMRLLGSELSVELSGVSVACGMSSSGGGMGVFTLFQ